MSKTREDVEAVRSWLASCEHCSGCEDEIEVLRDAAACFDRLMSRMKRLEAVVEAARGARESGLYEGALMGYLTEQLDDALSALDAIDTEESDG